MILKRVFLPLITVCAILFFAFAPAIENVEVKKAKRVINDSTENNIADDAKASKAPSVAALSSLLYDSLHLNKLGLSFEALQYAYTGYKKLADKGALKNDDILTVCDFSQPSSKKRMYIIDLENYKVLMNTYVAHGKNSGLQYAEKFSNTPESLTSSLGFYVTKGTYTGKHGLSLKLDGKEKGFNNNAESRAIVIHGANYIGDSRLGSPFMGRSFGCPAVPQELSAKVINYIKNGTCFFIYHPSTYYLTSSALLTT